MPLSEAIAYNPADESQVERCVVQFAPLVKRLYRLQVGNDLRQHGEAAPHAIEIERRAVKEIVPNSVARIGRADDIANAVAFLASPLADYIDGANLRVDGGYVAAIN